MNLAEQDNPDRRIVAQMRPREMWELICSSERQYLLVGDINPQDPQNMARFAPAISLLAFDGFKHLAIEWPEKPYQKIINDYSKANKADRQSGQDLLDLMTSFAIYPTPPSHGDSRLAETFSNHNCAVVYSARQHGLQLHALGAPHVPLSPKFIAAAHAQRAGAVFHAAQFKGAGGGGIDDLLPDDDTTYVLMGDAFSLQDQLKTAPRAPDFVLSTDLCLAWATPVARRNGLINA